MPEWADRNSGHPQTVRAAHVDRPEAASAPHPRTVPAGRLGAVREYVGFCRSYLLCAVPESARRLALAYSFLYLVDALPAVLAYSTRRAPLASSHISAACTRPRVTRKKSRAMIAPPPHGFLRPMEEKSASMQTYRIVREVFALVLGHSQQIAFLRQDSVKFSGTHISNLHCIAPQLKIVAQQIISLPY